MKEFTFIKKIVDWFKTLSGTQLAVGGAAIALTVAGVIGGVALWNAIGTSASGVGTESTESTESLIPGNIFTEESEVTEETEMTEEMVEINVHMTTTSIEKDLKIKIVDENGNLVSGFPFVVTVTPSGETDGQDYDDHDMDGIIYIKNLEGGDYKVLLQELEGIIIEKTEITATVKGKIEYEKVDIQNEIKDESQINVSVEDTANNNVVEEAPIVDTMALVESTTTTTAVPKDSVDLSKLPAAVVSTEKTTITMNKVSTEVVEDTSNSTNNTGNVDSTEVSGQNEGSLEPQGLSTGSAGVVQTTTVASVNAVLPSSVTLYTVGSEASMNADILLEITAITGSTDGMIQSFDWQIADENVATLAVSTDKKSATLTAKTVGKTKVIITFTYILDDKGTEDTAKLECEVVVSNHTDKTTQLVDVNGNLLYVDKEAKTPAYPADLATATEFYSNPKYTGWQSFDGYLYYYTAENVPATGTQIIGGVTYEFHEDGKLKESETSTGIDVSKWQGDIDWEAVANASIDFAIIRCGYRGSSTGVIVEDPYFKQNIKGATENGIKVGVYFFTQAITEAEAVEEASAAISWVQGYKLSFPIFIDTEGSGGRADSLGKTERTAIVKAFCETVRNSGYKPGIYASKYWYSDNLDESQLSTYNIWVAQYNTECNYRGRYDMWQYTSKGSVSGIKGNVDMNICYTKY